MVDSRYSPLGVHTVGDNSEHSSTSLPTPIIECPGSDTPPFHIKEVTLKEKNNLAAV